MTPMLGALTWPLAAPVHAGRGRRADDRLDGPPPTMQELHARFDGRRAAPGDVPVEAIVRSRHRNPFDY